MGGQTTHYPKPSIQRRPCTKGRVVTQGNSLHAFTGLQRTLGNRGLAQLVQAKLRVGAPDDRFEREADTVADQVMRGNDASVTTQVSGTDNRHIAETETLIPDGDPGHSSRPVSSANPYHNTIFPTAGGQPMPASDRTFFEPRFGRDFGGVRLHTGSRAVDVARAVNARAFTVGRHIGFDKGQYAPRTEGGRRLLAHELTHVVQQQSHATSTMPQLLRTPYPGCDENTTGVRDPDAMVNQARRDAISMVNGALRALRRPDSRTLLLLDRHFHCPASWQIRHIIQGLTQIRDELPRLTDVRCRRGTDAYCSNPMRMGGHGESPLDLPRQVFESLSPEELERRFEIEDALHLCPRFFRVSADYRRAVTFIQKVGPAGYGCMKRDPCYDDFYIPASSMIQNPFSYAWFAVELAGHPVRRPPIIPCRPIDTGTNVVVPPGAGSNPRLIRRLSGFETTDIPGAVILQLYVDRGGRYFVYHDGPEAGLYRQGERPRLYLPEGWRP